MSERDARTKLLRTMAERASARLAIAGERVTIVRDNIAVEILFDADRHVLQNIIWRATTRPPGTVPFKIYPEGLRSLAAKHFFGEDIKVGTGTFDLAFTVWGDDEDTIRRIWTRGHCGAMLADFAEGTVTSDGKTIALECAAYPGRQFLEAGYALVHGLASVDLFGFSALLALPGAVDHVNAKERYVTLPGPAEIRIGVVRDASGAATKISAHVPAPDESWVAAEKKARVLDARLSHRVDDAVMLFGEIVADRPRLVAAIELLRSLGAVPPQGIFR